MPAMKARAALVSRQPDNVVDAVPARYLGGAIGTAVVDDQPLHALIARNPAREIVQGDTEGLLLIVTRNFDDQLGHQLSLNPALPAMHLAHAASLGPPALSTIQGRGEARANIADFATP